MTAAPGTPGDDATSPPQSFTITVNAVNNAPTFVVGPNQSVNEDDGPQTVSPWATAIDDGDPESTQNVTFIITGNTQPSFFSAGPSVSPTGTLTYTPAPNAFGTRDHHAGPPRRRRDRRRRRRHLGSTELHDHHKPRERSAFLHRRPEPEPVFEDAGTVTVSPWATAISKGPANESGQTVMFNITSNTNPGLFSAGPARVPGGCARPSPRRRTPMAPPPSCWSSRTAAAAE